MSSDETLQNEAPAAESTESTTPSAPEPTAEAAPDPAPAVIEVAAEPVALTETPATVETPAAEPASAEPASAETSAPTEETSAAPRKVQLNPTGGQELKAAGTIANTTTDGEAVTDEEMALATANLAARQQADRNAEPVEIPDAKEVELGDLDAEIEAAMAGDSQQAAAAAAAAEAAGTPQVDLPEEGTRIDGIVQSVHGDDVFFDLGFRIPGIAQLRQFEGTETPEAGKKIRVAVRKVNEAEGLIEVNLPGGRQRLGGNWEAVEVGQIVDCLVNKTNKGGLEVSIGSMRAFLPAGQVDLAYVESLEPFVGQKLQVKIIEANQKKRNLVVSRRALLVEERKGLEKEFWETIEEGEEFTGRVKTIKDYGAFIDLGGADGFLHIGQIAWTHIKHPNEVLSEGQEVTVKVAKVEKDKKKISLSMKELTQNPWVLAADKYAPETTVQGKVTRATDFGAFVELEPGIEGLVHISELDHKRVNKVTDVVRVGQEVTAKVLEFDGNKKRVSLSLKALSEDPRIAAEAASEAEFQAAQANRKPREDLRGGIGSPSGGGGMFGNPTDFQ